MVALVLGIFCILGVTIALMDLQRELWDSSALDFEREGRLAFDLALGVFSMLGLSGTRHSSSSLGNFFRWAWQFYRNGLVGLEGIIPGIPPGDSATRLREARQYFNLESHVSSSASRYSAMQMAIPFARVAREGMDDSEESPDWVPRRVGKFLKK